MTGQYQTSQKNGKKTSPGLDDAQLVICFDENSELIQNKEIKAGNFTADRAQQNQYPITVHVLLNIPR
jgi:hypothetical protein